MDLRYKSYNTIFTVGPKGYPADPNLRGDGHPCFASAFPWNGVVSKNRFFKVFIYKEDGDLGYNHYCPFTYEQVYNHIRCAKSIVDFNFSVQEKDKGYCIKLHFKDATAVQQKYVLTWLRYLYEYPYNYWLLHAKWLRERFNKFRFESFANLFITVASCYGSYNDSHSIQLCPAKLKTNQELKQSCKRSKSLNTIYTSLAGAFKSYLDKNYITETWTNIDFENKIETYLKRYSVLKKH